MLLGYDTKLERIVEEPGPNVRHITGRPWLVNNSVNLLSTLICGLMTPLAAEFICTYLS